MKRFLKLYVIPLFLVCGISDQLIHTDLMASAQAIGYDTSSAHGQGGQAIPSVHDMFKDVSQDELLKMMEEGQQFIKYLEEHGTPEEKMAFSQAMEETLQGFTEADWQEFEAIVDTVQDKLPPLVIEPKETPVVEAVKEPVVKKEEIKVIDNSLEKVLQAIHKAINAILLKAKSDKVLAERITIGWDNKDEFSDMVRLLQTLQKKDHLAKLTTSSNEAHKSLLESIQNFNKRLQIENDQFVIADTFGLQADEKTTAANLKKLNKILEFFDSAVVSLLPKLIKFMEEYEPEALKKSEEHDVQAKKALEHATKIENQKKPMMPNYNDRSSHHGSQKNHLTNNANHQGGQLNQQAPQRQQDPSYLEQVHRENIKNIPALKKGVQGTEQDKKNNDDKKKENKEVSEFKKAIEALENYLETNGSTELGTYLATMNKAGNVYDSFGTPLNQADTNRFEKLQEKRGIADALQPEELYFVKKYEDQWKKAHDSFAKNTQAAHTYYSNLSDSIAIISPQLDEIIQTIQILKTSLNQMNTTDLEKLKASPELKKFEKRIEQYHATFKNVQKELRTKHQLHKIKHESPNTYSREERDYDDLAIKVESLHGLDKKISDAKSQLDYLQKSIKSAIAKSKREKNKAASKK